MSTQAFTNKLIKIKDFELTPNSMLMH